MPEIKLKARIQNKYETLDEWNKLTKGEFIPLKGEVCYGIKEDMLYKKIGDGQTDFIDLPWLLNQADNEVNDETSPAYIKNRLAYPEHIEVPEAEQLLYEGYFEVSSFVDGQYTLTPTDIATKLNNSDIVNLFKKNQTLMAAYASEIVFEDSRPDLFNKFNEIQFNYTNNDLKVDFYKNAQELSLLGYPVICQGNTNWANVLLNFVMAGSDEFVYREFFPFDEQQTDNFCIVSVGPLKDEEEIGFYLNYMLIDPTCYAPTYIDEESTDDSGNPIIITYPIYPFKLEIISYGQMHVIDDKYLGDVKSDFEELSSSSRTYIKNRPGINTIVEIADSYVESLGKYNSTITAGPYDSTLGQTLRGEDVHEDFASPDLMHVLETCTVTIDGETWYNCPVFQRTIVGSSDQRNAYYIGNPIHIANNTNKWLDLLMQLDPENTMFKGYKFYEELDNGLPFLVPYCPNSDSPLYDGGAYKFPKTYDNKEKFGITIVPEKMRLTTNIIRKDLLPQETVIGYLNNDLNSILLNSAYEASGTNSLAAGYGTKATASEAIALGNKTEANGIHSLSMGQENKAEGNNTLVTGLTTKAEGDQSVALGEGSVAFGDNSISAGGNITNYYSNITIQDNNNVLITNLNNIDYNQIRLYYKPSDNSVERYTPWFKIRKVYTTEQENVYRVSFDGYLSDYNKDFSQFKSVQIRKTNYTQEDNSFIFGVANRTNGIGSAAFGLDNTAKSAYSFVVGKNNKIGDEAFIIGNGSSNSNRSNAMTVDWNGQITANDYQVFTTDENGNLTSKSIQSDMEQSDPTQIDYVKNRTHYKYYAEFDKFIDLSRYGEKTIQEGFKLIKDYNYQLTPSGEYKLTLEVLNDNADTVLHTLTEDLQIKNGAEIGMEIDGAEDIVVLFSAQYNIPVFVSGIDLTEENIITIGEKSLVISAANYYDQGNPVRLTLEGPGFSGKKIEYKKLDKEYLDIEEQDLLHNEYQVYWDQSDSITYEYTLTPIDDFENQNVIDFPDWVKTEEEGRVYWLETYYNTPSGFAVLKGMSLINDYQESVDVRLDPNFPKYQYGVLGAVAFQKNTDGEYKARSLGGLLGSGMEMGLSIPLREYLDKGYRELEIQFSGNCHCGGDMAYNPQTCLQAACATTKVTDFFANDLFENDRLMQSTYTEYSDLSEDIQNQYWKTEGSIPFTGVTVSGQENLILSSTRFNGRLKLLFSEKSINCSYEYKLNPMAYRTEDSPHYYYPLNVSDYSIISLDPNNTFNTTNIITAANYLYLISIPLTYDTKILGIWRK